MKARALRRLLEKAESAPNAPIPLERARLLLPPGLFQAAVEIEQNADSPESREEAAKRLVGRMAPLLRAANARKNLWMLKPGCSSRGRGIQVMDNLAELRKIIKPVRPLEEDWVVQKYLEEPLLLRGRKFDIRCFALISSADPLAVWMHEEYYLRISAKPFDLEVLDLNTHLTNFSISKYVPKEPDEPFPERMLSRQEFKEFLLAEFGPGTFEQLEHRFREILAASAKAAAPSLTPRPGAFELLGVDLMVDSCLQPWIIEFNATPSMEKSTSITERVIDQVFTDLASFLDQSQLLGIRPNVSSWQGFQLLYSDSEPKFATLNLDFIKLAVKGTKANAALI